MLNLSNIPDPYKHRPTNSPTVIRARSLEAGNSGRTTGGRFTSASILANAEGDDYPADSQYWRGQMQASIQHMKGLLTVVDAGVWVELVWPGETIRALSCRTIRDMAEASIDAYANGERDIQNLAEAAHGRLAQLTEMKR